MTLNLKESDTTGQQRKRISSSLNRQRKGMMESRCKVEKANATVELKQQMRGIVKLSSKLRLQLKWK